jgi:rfaE bifunctional protein kinase chain/domain
MTEDTRRLLKIIDAFPHLRIAVWGDIILDEYLTGATRRVSREAPVLILAFRNREFFLGGAGNAILNLNALGVEAVPIGVLGNDDSGRMVRRILKKSGVSAEAIWIEKGYPTPLKTRILAGEDNTRKQQILRIDREGQVPDSAKLKAGLREALAKAAENCDALLVSDYHYATVKTDIFPDVLAEFKAGGKPVSLDSRFRLLQFPGASVATPNEPEAEDALNVRLDGENATLREAGATLRRKLRSSAVLITRGSRGMALFEKGRPPFFLPVSGTKDIVDVTGAGDTVISVFTAALAGGASFREAARLANVAGGLVVMKKGTAQVTSHELKLAVVAEH